MEAARAATAADIDRLVALALELRGELRVMRGGALWEVRESRVEPVADMFAELLARDDAVVLAGTIDDVVVGYGTLELETLARRPRARGSSATCSSSRMPRAVGVGEAIATELVARADRGRMHRRRRVRAAGPPGDEELLRARRLHRACARDAQAAARRARDP